MPQVSPADSSKNSKPASKNSTAAASHAAAQAFSTVSDLSFGATDPKQPSQQQGRRRLTDTFMIERTRIMPDPDQPRQEFDKLELLELVASIRERGIMQPLTVRWNRTASKYMIIDGGRRYEAAREAGVEELPCWVREGDRQEVLIDQIVHNWQRSNLRPMETADALARLRDEFGITQTELCRVTGKRKSEISKFLSLHDRVTPEVQEMARNKHEKPLSKRHLYGISKLDSKQQKPLADRVISENLSAEQTEHIVRSASPKVNTPRNSVTGIAARQRRFKTSKADVLITFRQKKISAADVRDVVRELSDAIDHSETE